MLDMVFIRWSTLLCICLFEQVASFVRGDVSMASLAPSLLEVEPLSADAR